MTAERDPTAAQTTSGEASTAPPKGPGLTGADETTRPASGVHSHDPEQASILDGEKERPWGPLVLIELIGSGGFGDVYRARDPALGRDVALKLLKPTRLLAPAARDSIVREGTLLARVRHPNVMAVYGARQVEGEIGVWSELLTGRTLAQIVKADGVFSAQEALGCAETLCRALSAVHRAGLLHRDIKAQNVMRERGGRIVLMDFGLGRDISDLRDTAASDAAGSPDLAGTPLYLAPELFTGSLASVQSDIYSLGVLLFFLVTGTFPVQGGRRLEEIGEQHRLGKRQRLRDLRPDLPAPFIETVERALNPDPAKRFESCGAFHDAVSHSLLPSADPSRSSRTRVVRRAALLGLGVLLGVVGTVVWRSVSAPQETPLTFSVSPPPGSRFSESARNIAVISPDGQYVAFVATDAAGTSQLWLRSLHSLDAQLVPDSRGAASPFWAPDSSAIAFFSRSGLRQMTLSGVRSETLVNVTEDRGGAWSPTGEFLIVPGPRDGLFRLPASGGQPQLVIAPDRTQGEIGYLWPQFLADGRRFIYFVLSNDERVRGIYLGSLGGGRGRRLMAADASGVIAGDHLLFVRDGALAEQPFDSRSGELRSVAEQVVKNVATNLEFRSAVSATSTGALVYSSADTTDVNELAWYDRRWSQLLSRVDAPAKFMNPALSRDGRYLAVEQYNDSLSEIRIFDLFNKSSMRVAPAAKVADPVWAPDGRLAYAASQTGWLDIYVTTPEGANTQTALVKSESDKMPTDWSRDGKFLAYTNLPPNGTYDLWILPLAGGQPYPILATDAQEASAKFSPDGRWLAYISSASGQAEVYVRTFPLGDVVKKVSTNGGYDPFWDETGKLLYLDFAGRLMQVDAPTGPGNEAGPPRQVLLTKVITPGASRNHFVLNANGTQVLVNSPVYDARAATLTVVFHWPALMKR